MHAMPYQQFLSVSADASDGAAPANAVSKYALQQFVQP